MLLSRRNGKAQPANMKKWRENKVTWSLFPFTFHVSVVLNLSITEQTHGNTESTCLNGYGDRSPITYVRRRAKARIALETGREEEEKK